jgi:integrase
VKEPFRLYRRCEKNGRAARCPAWPACACDWYDRPTRPDGRRPWVRLAHTATSKELAYRLALKARQDAQQIAAGLVAVPKAPAPRLRAALAAYLATPAVQAQATRAKLATNLAHFVAAVGDRPIDAILPPTIDAWRAGLLLRRSKKTGGTWSRNTAQRVFNSVKGFFAYAVADLALAVNPCAALPDWSADPAPRRLWAPDEQWLIDVLPPAFGLPLKIGFLCGCRRAEALALTRHDLSPKGFVFPGSSPKLGWIALQRKKKRGALVKVRIPIALAIVEELRALIVSPFQQYVFGDPAPSPDAWSSQLTRRIRALGATYHLDTRGLCMHGTRHTATTTMQDLPGVSAQTARNMGGWTTTRMVETYSSPAEASLQVAAMGLAARWKPRKPKGLAKAAPAARKRA